MPGSLSNNKGTFTLNQDTPFIVEHRDMNNRSLRSRIASLNGMIKAKCSNVSLNGKATIPVNRYYVDNDQNFYNSLVQEANHNVIEILNNRRAATIIVQEKEYNITNIQKGTHVHEIKFNIADINADTPPASPRGGGPVAKKYVVYNKHRYLVRKVENKNAIRVNGNMISLHSIRGQWR